MPRAKHRVIIDTNLWISFLLTKDFSKIDQLFRNDEIRLLFSQELLDEFVEVAERPKFKKYFLTNDLQNLISEIQTKAEFINVTSSIDLCRDKKDNFLLELATDGNASHLVTGDKGLLVLEKIGITQISTMTDFISEV